MSDNWIVANLENAFSTWNDKMAEIWNVISGTNGGLEAIGLGLLILFFAMSIFKSTASFRDFQRPEYALKHFIRFWGQYISAFASNSTPTINTSITTVTMIWKYIGEVIFNMLALVGLMRIDTLNLFSFSIFKTPFFS